MRQPLTNLVLTTTLLGGCSLIYNPSNIETPPPDAIDAPELDAYIPDVTKLTLTDVGPRVVYEGQGDGGSRKAVIVVTGSDFVASLVTVELVAPGGEPVMIDIDPASVKVSPFGSNVLAFEARFPVDSTRDEGAVKLDVVVTQGTVTKTLSDKLELRNLDELDAASPAITASSDLKDLYARVELPAGLTFGAGGGPVLIRAVSSIEIGNVTANALGSTPGPGGKAGGAATKVGMGAGGGGPGGFLMGGLVPGGGGAGHEVAGTGGGMASNGGPAVPGPNIISYAATYGSGGGGGGGSMGGGGGGTIELTAGGTIEAGDLLVRGGNGGTGSGGLPSSAGGGAGGVLVVRAGTTATLTGVADAAGGTGGQSGTKGGNGSRGRMRIDASTVVGPADMTNVAVHAGAAFASGLPLITSDRAHQILVSGTIGDSYGVFIFNAAGAQVDTSTLSFSASTTAAINPALAEGYNRVCVVPTGTLPDENAESTRCIELAYLR